MSEAEIASLREDIAATDREIVGLVARRLYLAEQIGWEKRLGGQPIRVSEIETQVAARIAADCQKHGVGSAFAEALSRVLIEESVRRQECLPAPKEDRGTALVIGGAGRMGRWLCRYLRSQGFQVRVHDRSDSPMDLARIVPSAEVIAVAVPMDAASSVLEAVDRADPAGLVFDIASLKTPVARALRALAGKGRTVASVHPLFGPRFGPLSEATILLSDCGSPAGLDGARSLFVRSGAHLVDVPLEDHDEIMATVLGLSHLTLLAFARAAARAPVDPGLFPTEGTTFMRLTVAARTLLDDPPELLREIQALNPHSPGAQRRLAEAVEAWGRATADPAVSTFGALLQDARRLGGTTR